MSELPSIEQLHQLFLYEPETGRLINRVARGSRVRAGEEAGSYDSRGYLRVQVNGKRPSVHRIIFAMHHGRWPSAEIDHINGVRDDNRLANLREANSSENKRNVGKKSNNTSGLVGVSWNERDRRWQARVSIGDEYPHLGYYREKMMAADVYNFVAAQTYGEFLHESVPADSRITLEVLELLVYPRDLRHIRKALDFHAALKQVAAALSVRGATV